MDMSATSLSPSTPNLHAPIDRVQVERWPSEIPLRALLILATLGVWALLTLSMVGIFYALLLMVFFFVSHLLFVAHIRGSGIRLSPQQFPALYARVEELAHRAGLTRTPEVYIIQAGGALNALATKFLRSRILVLYTDLLDACGDNESARDMIIGHEIGHLKAGHLNWAWILMPGYFVPFLGSAYSRACEYTCDRYGAALARDRSGALLGLAILASGRSHAARVNLQSLVDQKKDLNTGWMTLAKWLMSHPPLCDRIAALEPQLIHQLPVLTKGPIRALLFLALVLVIPAAGIVTLGVMYGPQLQAFLEQFRAPAPESDSALSEEQIQEWSMQVLKDMESLAAVINEHYLEAGSFPEDNEALSELWQRLRSGEPEPIDPFDGGRYGYRLLDNSYYLWSSGPDRESETDDDLKYHGRIPLNRQ